MRERGRGNTKLQIILITLPKAILCLTLPVDKDESGEHEEGVEVEHFAFVILKSETLIELENPVSEQDDGAKEANLSEHPEKAEEAARTGRRLVVQVLVLVIRLGTLARVGIVAHGQCRRGGAGTFRFRHCVPVCRGV